MGNEVSKRKDQKKTVKSKNTPRNSDSIQSLNIHVHGSVSTNPDPNAYSQLEVKHTLSRTHSVEAVVECRLKTQQDQTTGFPVQKEKNECVPGSQQEPNTGQAYSGSLQHSPDLCPYHCHYEGKNEDDLIFKQRDIRRLIHDKQTNKQIFNRGQGLQFERSQPFRSSFSVSERVKAAGARDRSRRVSWASDIIPRPSVDDHDTKADVWNFVKNFKTGQEGRVPTNFVEKITSIDVESQKYLFQLNKKEAEEKLLEPEIEIGTYLLRRSAKTGAFALSLRCENELYEVDIMHYKIRIDDNGVCYIDADSNIKIKPFSNIIELITYYTVKPGLRCKLKTPLFHDSPLDDLDVECSDLQLGKKLGSGNFGSVYAGHANSGSIYHSPDLKSKPKVIATMDYEAENEDDISFNKGDIMQLINDEASDGWYVVENFTTGEEGRVPIYYVETITSVDMESQKYFFQLNKKEAEEKLQESEIGTYLIRRSADPGTYALSLRCENEFYELAIKHYKIQVDEKGVCYIDADTNIKPFSNIMDLIRYYTEEPGLRCKLKTPLPHETTLEGLAVKSTDFTLGEKLGSGNYGIVYAGTLHNNKQVAVKFLKTEGSMTVAEFRKEAETMHKLRHPNLVSLLAICEDRGKIYIITERMSRGALLTLLREDTDHNVKFTDIMEMAFQVAEGMCYLEMKGFVHRDLRAANVLVGDGNITKIADFGLARLLDNYYEHENFYQEKKGTAFPYKWTAPEAIKQQKFTVKSDVWSFGILLYEMVTHGDEPYAAMSNSEVFDWVEKGNRLSKPVDQPCPMTLYNIMKQCWLKSSDDRPNFADIKEIVIEIKTIA